MIELTDVLQVEQATLEAPGPEQFGQVAFDSRALPPESLFFALQSGARDGHDFVPAAIDGGATGLVVSAEVSAPDGVAVVRVPDTLVALQQLAAARRDRFTGTVIAITGSAGKTTVRGFVEAAARTGLDTHASPASFNNHIGLPFSILGTQPEAEALVVEVGTNHRGEIAALGNIAAPDIALVTNVGHAHIGNFASQDELADEKTDLLRATREGGTWIVNGDNKVLASAIARIGRTDSRLITVGLNEGNTITLSEVAVSESGTTARLVVDGESFPLRLAAHGRHFAVGASMAVAVAKALDLDLAQAIAALEAAEGEAGRANLITVNDQLMVVDDTHNASPDAMLAGLDLLQDLSADRRVAVIGEMRELGDLTEALHDQVGRRAADVADHIIAVGDGARTVVASALEAGAGQPSAEWVGSALDAYHAVDRYLADQSGSSAVFVKGSRFSHMERVVVGLTDAAPLCGLASCSLYISCRACDQLFVESTA